MPILSAEDLEVRISGETLLSGASFQVLRGELAVLIGPSGSGKTVLLKVLAGIMRSGEDGLVVGGKVRYEGEDLLGHRQAPGRIGILFQHHALFDELNARENVLFALHHGRRDKDPRRAEALLEHLGVRPEARLRHLSGGQLQRVALARAIAIEPELLLYDEPTTGLDSANAARVAQLILGSHKEGHRTSLVVTHDLAAFRDIADRILFLDPVRGVIEAVKAEELEGRLVQASEHRGALSPAARLSPPPWPRRFLEATYHAVRASALAVLHLVPAFPRPRYGWRYLRHAFALTASVGAFGYLLVAGTILGFVSTYFTFEHLPKRTFTEPLFIDEILGALGYLTYRVLAPVLITVLIAARTGAAIASDVGNKVYARQFDALRSFGVAPSRYLLSSVLWALLLAMPVLFAAAFLIARSLSLAVFIFTHPDESFFFWDQNFHRALRVPDAFLWAGTGWLLLKIELCAFGTAAIAYFQGARPKHASDEVSSAVTRTIIGASLFVLLVHFGMAFFEF